MSCLCRSYALHVLTLEALDRSEGSEAPGLKWFSV
jgi:hypothetical protein